MNKKSAADLLGEKLAKQLDMILSDVKSIDDQDLKVVMKHLQAKAEELVDLAPKEKLPIKIWDILFFLGGFLLVHLAAAVL